MTELLSGTSAKYSQERSVEAESMEGTDLTLEQKSLKRANYALTSSISYVSIPLILMYLGQILQGYSVVMILCIAAYRNDRISHDIVYCCISEKSVFGKVSFSSFSILSDRI